jgi:hypothetical protein
MPETITNKAAEFLAFRQAYEITAHATTSA